MHTSADLYLLYYLFEIYNNNNMSSEESRENIMFRYI